MALVAGLVGTVVFGRLWKSGWLLVLLVCVLFVFLSQRDTSRRAIVSGLYATAGFVLLYPPVVLVDRVVSQTGPDGGGLWVAAVLYTLLVRLPIAVVLAGGIAGAAYLIDRCASVDRIREQGVQ